MLADAIADRRRLAASLAKGPAFVRAQALWSQVQVLAPAGRAAYRQLVFALGLIGDVAGMEALAARAEASLQQPAPAKQTTKDEGRSGNVVFGLTSRHAPTAAAAWVVESAVAEQAGDVEGSAAAFAGAAALWPGGFRSEAGTVHPITRR